MILKKENDLIKKKKSSLEVKFLRTIFIFRIDKNLKAMSDLIYNPSIN